MDNALDIHLIHFLYEKSIQISCYGEIYLFRPCFILHLSQHI